MARSAANLKFAKPISNGALKDETLPQRIKILGWGKSSVLDGLDEVTFDDESAKIFYDTQKKIGRMTAPLDFNHNTVPGTKAYEADKEPRAIAGYGVVTVVPNDGVYYEYMQWTPSGQKSARDYIDLSPTVLTDANNRVVGIHSCALTPAGAIENLSFYSAENLKLYSADSVTTLMDQLPKSHNADCDEDDKEVKSMAADKTSDHESKYGDVEYADPKRHAYPINTEAHVRAAWSYINMPKNQKGYSPEELSAIKRKIAAKAKQYGIEIKTMSADRAQANAYVTDPYTGIDDMIEEHMDFFRKKLGLPDSAEPEDVMSKLKEVWLAKWEGADGEKNVLPQKTAGSSVDPTVRNAGSEHEKDVKTTISYTPEEQAKRHKEKFERKYADTAKEMIAEALKPLSAELETLRNERSEAVKNAEKTQRDAIVAEASKLGKVIPLSAEEIEAMPVATLRSMVSKLKPELDLSAPADRIRPLSADEAKSGKITVPAGALSRANDRMTEYFKSQSLEHTGPARLSPSSN